MLKNVTWLAIVSVDTAENELSKLWGACLLPPCQGSTKQPYGLLLRRRARVAAAAHRAGTEEAAADSRGAAAGLAAAQPPHEAVRRLWRYELWHPLRELHGGLLRTGIYQRVVAGHSRDRRRAWNGSKRSQLSNGTETWEVRSARRKWLI